MGKCLKKFATTSEYNYQDYENVDRNDVDNKVKRRNETSDLFAAPENSREFNSFQTEFERRNQNPDHLSFDITFENRDLIESSFMRNDAKNCVLQCFFKELKMV